MPYGSEIALPAAKLAGKEMAVGASTAARELLPAIKGFFRGTPKVGEAITKAGAKEAGIVAKEGAEEGLKNTTKTAFTEGAEATGKRAADTLTKGEVRHIKIAKWTGRAGIAGTVGIFGLLKLNDASGGKLLDDCATKLTQWVTDNYRDVLEAAKDENIQEELGRAVHAATSFYGWFGNNAIRNGAINEAVKEANDNHNGDVEKIKLYAVGAASATEVKNLGIRHIARKLIVNDVYKDRSEDFRDKLIHDGLMQDVADVTNTANELTSRGIVITPEDVEKAYTMAPEVLPDRFKSMIKSIDPVPAPGEEESPSNDSKSELHQSFGDVKDGIVGAASMGPLARLATNFIDYIMEKLGAVFDQATSFFTTTKDGIKEVLGLFKKDENNGNIYTAQTSVPRDENTLTQTMTQKPVAPEAVLDAPAPS